MHPVLVPPAGQLLFWGRARTPGSAGLGAGSELSADPDFGAISALRNIQKVAMKEARRVFPFVLVVLI